MLLLLWSPTNGAVVAECHSQAEALGELLAHPDALVFDEATGRRVELTPPPAAASSTESVWQ